MLSTTSDHALRAILALARRVGTAPVRADSVADEIGAPRNYLAKTLNALAKAGVVTSVRGPQGGFALAIAPESLTIARVIDCFDESRPRPRCMLRATRCQATRPCVAHDEWQRITAARRTPFLSTTIADLLRGTPHAVPVE